MCVAVGGLSVTIDVVLNGNDNETERHDFIDRIFYNFPFILQLWLVVNFYNYF